MKNLEKRSFKLVFVFLSFLVLSFLIISNQISAHAFDEHLFSKVYTFGNINDEKTRINVSVVDDENIIFLPSNITPDSVALFTDFPENVSVTIKGDNAQANFVNGMKIDLNQFCSGDEYVLKFICSNTDDSLETRIKFVFSENIPSIYLVSDNPTEQGREWVESSPQKKNKAKGHIVMQKSDGNYIHSGALTQIKGRGNSTWNAVKKPYQIKTETKVDLLGTGNDKNKSKTWVLLANYADPSLLRNTISLRLGEDLGLSQNIQCTPVDLYYDGEYRGNYLLAEKVEIGSGRVDISNLEDQNEKANTEVILEDLPIKSDVTDNGAVFTYCDGMNSPEDISGGYLLEMDYSERALEEICYFKTTRGQYIVVKSPEYASKEEMNYIATLYQEYEDSIYNNGINPYTGKHYYEYVDAESVAIYYLVNEFSKTKDFFNSSAYLYKNTGDDKLYMGPLWDFDSGYGISGTTDGNRESAIGLSEYNTEFSIKLLSIEHFYKTTQSLYNTKFKDLVTNLILSNTESENENNNLNSLLFESKLISASSTNNAMLWYDFNTKEETEILSMYIEERINSLDEIFSPELNAIPESKLEFLERTYKDVPLEAWFYSIVESATQLGYMNGTGNGFFEPFRNIKRSELAQVIYNLSGERQVFEFRQSYTDVLENDWYSCAIMWVTEMDIMNGYSDSTFRPDNYVTREEVIYYLYKTKKVGPSNTSLIENFTDYSSVSHFAKDAMEWAVSEKIIIGDDMNRLNPSAYITRAEFATILVRYR